MYLPDSVVEDYVRFLHIDNRLQGGNVFLAFADGFMLFIVIRFLR